MYNKEHIDTSIVQERAPIFRATDRKKTFALKNTVMSKKILVTGSAGRLGGMIVQQLLDKGYSCVGTDRMPFSGSPCEFVQCDLCDAGEVEKLFAASDITDVVHVAAVPGPAACVPGCGSLLFSANELVHCGSELVLEAGLQRVLRL